MPLNNAGMIAAADASGNYDLTAGSFDGTS
jgi:hypothetical protein